MKTLKHTPKMSPLMAKLKTDFVGLDTEYKVLSGEMRRRVYLDSTASTLMMGPAYRAANRFLKHYANTHSVMHTSARIATQTYHWVHQRILDFTHANNEYAAFFIGSGVTAGMNRVARAFRDLRPERDVVLVSIMEHHSNDLPHRKHGGTVVHIPADTHDSKMGCVDLNTMEDYLKKYEGRVNYVSVTGISNVTGIINPIEEVAKLAHKYKAYVVVDAAQLAAHVPIQITGHDDPAMDADVLIFSGHKTYAPGSPGVVIARKSILSSVFPVEVGGGMVGRVYPDSYNVKPDFPDREEAGTPNILGAITLGAAVDVLDRIGMEEVMQEDVELTSYAMENMLAMDDVVIYGNSNLQTCLRAGSISFNIREMDHGLVAAVLNDVFNVAVRNECFCAHPYVEKMLELTHAPQIKDAYRRKVSNWHDEPWMGMVRASFGLYTTEEDVDWFIDGLADIIANRNKFQTLYELDEEGNYRHKTFRPQASDYFDLERSIREELI